MAKQPTCPECSSTGLERIDVEPPKSANLRADHLYATVECENGHEYGLELVVATILE